MGRILQLFLSFSLLMSAMPTFAHCGRAELLGLIPSGDYLLKLFKEARSMSYVSQTDVGRNPFRKAKANARFLSEAIPLSSQEIEFVRTREKKFRLNDEEIADYYMIKIYNEITVEKSRLLRDLAFRNFANFDLAPTRDQLALVQAALRYINSDLNSLSEDDLEKAQGVLAKPLVIFDEKALRALLDTQVRWKNQKITYDLRRTEQTRLMEAGFDANVSSLILNYLTGPTSDNSSCCQSFVTSVPCVACGLNVSYNHLELERSKKGLPKFPVSTDTTSVPTRLFIYQRSR